MKQWLGGLAVMLVILGLLAGIWIFDRPVTAEDRSPSEEITRMLGIWEGRLALFEGDASLPRQVYEVWITTLPEPEQQRLADGIPVTDEQTLQSLLEDYTG